MCSSDLSQLLGFLIQRGFGGSLVLLRLLQLELDPVELLSLFLEGGLMRLVAPLQARHELGRGDARIVQALQRLYLI